jgi:hypothetical protein
VIFGDNGPPVGQFTDFGPTCINHRLDGEGHSSFQLKPCAGLAVVKDLGLLVKPTPDQQIRPTGVFT